MYVSLSIHIADYNQEWGKLTQYQMIGIVMDYADRHGKKQNYQTCGNFNPGNLQITTGYPAFMF